MTNIEERIATLEKELEILKAEVAETKAVETWDPYTDTFYILSVVGEILVHRSDVSCGFIDKLSAIGNVFRTEEDAKFAMERLKVLHEMYQMADGDIEHLRFIIVLDTYKMKFVISRYASTAFGVPTFASERSAEACIDKIGKDRLKKYYFGVKEIE